jgi:hypothetical protein
LRGTGQCSPTGLRQADSSATAVALSQSGRFRSGRLDRPLFCLPDRVLRKIQPTCTRRVGAASLRSKFSADLRVASVLRPSLGERFRGRFALAENRRCHPLTDLTHDRDLLPIGGAGIAPDNLQPLIDAADCGVSGVRSQDEVHSIGGIDACAGVVKPRPHALLRVALLAAGRAHLPVSQIGKRVCVLQSRHHSIL